MELQKEKQLKLQEDIKRLEGAIHLFIIKNVYLPTEKEESFLKKLKLGKDIEHLEIDKKFLNTKNDYIKRNLKKN